MFLWEVWCYFLFKPFTGNHTIAVVKGKEDHETLRESLANFIQDVNNLVKDGEINVDGQAVQLEFFLGGDYKVNNLFSCLISKE